MERKLENIEIESIDGYFDGPDLPRLDVILKKKLDDNKRLKTKREISSNLTARLTVNYSHLSFTNKESVDYITKERHFEIYSDPYKVGYKVRDMLGIENTGFIIISMGATNREEAVKFLAAYKRSLSGMEK